jgi:hypothetical protein
MRLLKSSRNLCPHVCAVCALKSRNLENLSVAVGFSTPAVSVRAAAAACQTGHRHSSYKSGRQPSFQLFLFHFFPPNLFDISSD